MKSLCLTRQPAPASTKASALGVWLSSSACGSGTRIAGRPTTASSLTVPAPERAMTRWAAAMRRGMSEKKLRKLRFDSNTLHKRPEPNQYLPGGIAARFASRAHRLWRQFFDGGGHDFAENARALAAAENEQMKRAVGLRRVIGHIGQGHDLGPHRIAGVDDLRHVPGQKADQRQIGRDQLHMIGDEAIGAAEQRIGRQNGRRQARQTGRDHDRQRRIAAEAHDGARLEAAQLDAARAQCRPRSRTAPRPAAAANGRRRRRTARFRWSRRERPSRNS